MDVPAPTVEARSIVFPFDSYELSDNDIVKTYEATDDLVRSCMREKGHEWGLIKTPEYVPSWRNRLHFGVVEPDVASRFGYHAPAELLSSPEYRSVVKQMSGRLASLSKDAASDAAICQKEAGQTLTRGAKTSLAKFNDLKSSTFEAAKRDHNVKNAAAKWKACMRAAGFDYATPWDAARKWGAKGDPVKREIATAVSDVICKKKTGIVTIWFSTERNLEEIEIGKDRIYFNDLKSANERYTENVRATLSKE
ncbi:hypothetical protein [Streptomyces sp. ITFR-6]|uniref:hypothetical protein n=1 Tax=Streptomyces sp. ITFR-6 TaxID=3075197 RepID=UPI00288BEB75|nr:hypothetical protein [Streptomyces sp. ITFR-6]WNI31321.1 hypothetical protein RLT59_22935 [Streptomyces sp. ITFR-6]